MTSIGVTDKRAIQLGVKVQVWYLVNLLILPGIGFMFVGWLAYQYRRNKEGLFAIGHAKGALIASLVGGGAIVFGCLLLWLLVADPQNTLPLIVLYFTMMHSTFILWGILNVARAMAGKSVAPFGFDV